MCPGTDVNWFVIHSKARHEALAASQVQRLGPEVFFPRFRQERLIRRCWRKITRPLFPGYFFARFCPCDSLEPIRHLQGVLAVLCSSRVPIPVGDQIISGLRDRAAEDGFVRLQLPGLRVGDRAVIEHGPFEGFIGQVERESNDGSRVTLLLEAMAHRARVIVEKRCLRARPVDRAAA